MGALFGAVEWSGAVDACDVEIIEQDRSSTVQKLYEFKIVSSFRPR